jgi:hypothetical protein
MSQRTVEGWAVDRFIDNWGDSRPYAVHLSGDYSFAVYAEEDTVEVEVRGQGHDTVVFGIPRTLIVRMLDASPVRSDPDA